MGGGGGALGGSAGSQGKQSVSSKIRKAHVLIKYEGENTDEGPRDIRISYIVL